MLLRFMADVVALKPRIVHILAGTNDIAGNTGPISERATLDNLQAMAMLARASGIGVLLGNMPPAAAFWWQPGFDPRPRIRSLNAAIAEAVSWGVAVVDYHAALAKNDGAMRKAFADDGVHPNASGYAAMERVLLPVLPSRLHDGC